MRFINAPFVNEEQTTRSQWPRATMTYGERKLFREGWSIHRDATMSGSRSPIHVDMADGQTLSINPLSYGRSRQDAPAGSGAVLLHSPTALDASRRGFRLPNPIDSPQSPPIPSLAATMRGGLAPLRMAPHPPAPAAEIPISHRMWDPMARGYRLARTAEPAMRTPLAAPHSSPEPWQLAIRQSFPRCTGHDVRVDKVRLAEIRAAERWAARLNESM